MSQLLHNNLEMLVVVRLNLAEHNDIIQGQTHPTPPINIIQNSLKGAKCVGESGAQHSQFKQPFKACGVVKAVLGTSSGSSLTR